LITNLYTAASLRMPQFVFSTYLCSAFTHYLYAIVKELAA